MTPDAATQEPAPVTVVVPVYRDLEATRNCLQSLLASGLPGHMSVLVIDDCSPEPDVSALCREVAAAPQVELYSHEHNLGFVACANRAFEMRPDHDIILLNSDTVVPRGWAERLQACACRDPRIGTATPFSNNGSICSYPASGQANDLPAGLALEELDELFRRANQGLHADLPTAVGFCMYIRRACLEQTGPFDQENFGKGYGEECDFCIRAAQLGWRHVVAADVFVFHEGGASFAQEANARREQADSVLHALHPAFHDTVMDFILSDPLEPLRAAINRARVERSPHNAVQVLDEQREHTRAMLHHATLYREDLKTCLHQLDESEAQLQACRTSFEQTDQALRHAESVVAALHTDIAQLNQGVAERDARLREELSRSALLEQKIAGMEQSRSWRYTAWLRRGKQRAHQPS
ncbi:MAG: hypothetical protein CME59_03995 [Halioglobus sp.]|nr:hypothetical protein [Halioglobus sp.]